MGRKNEMIARLTEDNERLFEALLPFAEAKIWKSMVDADTDRANWKLWAVGNDAVSPLEVDLETSLTVDHLRAARSVIDDLRDPE